MVAPADHALARQAQLVRSALNCVQYLETKTIPLIMRCDGSVVKENEEQT